MRQKQNLLAISNLYQRYEVLYTSGDACELIFVQHFAKLYSRKTVFACKLHFNSYGFTRKCFKMIARNTVEFKKVSEVFGLV